MIVEILQTVVEHFWVCLYVVMTLVSHPLSLSAAKNFQNMLDTNDEKLFELKEPIWEGMLSSSELKAG